MKQPKILILFIIFISIQTGAAAQKVQSQLEILNINTGERTVIHSDTVRFSAPVWTPNGIIISQKGSLHRIPEEGGETVKVPLGFATSVNNHNGISPDGTLLALSHHAAGRPEGMNSTIYVVSAGGGIPRQVTQNSPSYWHDWSPDGKTLLYTARRNGQANIYTIPAGGGEETQLTHSNANDMGPDFSPDGQTIYFNSNRSGSMQIWKMNSDGTEPVQITDDHLSNWYPHPSPDGQFLVFLSFPDAVASDSIPADKNAILRLLDLTTFEITELAHFTGGKGSIDVPSWSPGSQRIAFVSYNLSE